MSNIFINTKYNYNLSDSSPITIFSDLSVKHLGITYSGNPMKEIKTPTNNNEYKWISPPFYFKINGTQTFYLNKQGILDLKNTNIDTIHSLEILGDDLSAIQPNKLYIEYEIDSAPN